VPPIPPDPSRPDLDAITREESMSQPLETTRPLSPDQRRLLLAQMLQEQASRSAERPLSLGQERLWLMARLEPDSPLYHIAVAYRLHGPLVLPALEQGIRRIAERHEVLRATFPAGDGQPVALVGPEARPAFAVSDLRDLPAGDRQARSADLAAEVARRPFDLARGPLWRVAVIRWSDQGHDLVLAMHHIISDAWSFSLFGRELAECYDAACSGRLPRLAELPMPYSEFAQRQRQRLSGRMYEEQLAYWRTHLEGEVPGLRLPTDRPASAAMLHRGSFQSVVIPARVATALGALSRRENATLFMTLLAGFEVLLHRSSGQEDLVLCTPTSGRHRSGSKDLIGYFNNILPMRFDLRGDPRFVELVRRTRRVALDAFKHQDLPIQVIADSPNLKAVTLSRVLFSLDIEWPPKLALSGLTCEAQALRTGTSEFDLSVSLWEDGAALRGVFEYKTELFHEETVAWLIADYLDVLEALAQDPERTLSSLPAATRPGMTERLAAVPRAPVVLRAPGTPTELRVLQEWEDVLGIQDLGLNEDLFELGVTSLGVARLAERLRRMFHVELPLSTIFQARTAAQIAALVRQRRAMPPASALAPIRREGTHPPLFLCEGVGIYYPLIRHLSPDQPVYALFTEVRSNYPRVVDLAAAYLAEVRTVQPEGPYFLGGLSFGGIVAFEMAQQLYECGEEVALLALFDTPTPWATAPKPLPKRLAGHLANLRRFGLGYVRTKVRRRLRRRPGLREDSASQILADAERLRQLFGELAASYDLRAYPGRITLFVLAERGSMGDTLFDPALEEIDPHLGWGRIAPGRVELQEVPGGHTSIFQEPFVQLLAEKLTDCLEIARQAAPPRAGSAAEAVPACGSMRSSRDEGLA
jgi:thioesterase domain-containing protein